MAQCHYGETVRVETAVEALGRTSVTLLHTLIQGGIPVAKGQSVMVHFDYGKAKSLPIPEGIRCALREHLVEEVP